MKGMDSKKNLPLLLAISIPVLMVVLVAVSIYVPGMFVHPHINFLYSTGDDVYGQPQYFVQGNTLVKADISSSTSRDIATGPIKLYVHDVSANSNHEVTYEEASMFNLDPDTTSSDGFEIVHGSSGSNFPFLFFETNDDYNTWYLKGHTISKKLNLQISGESYYNNFRFLGWIQ